MATTVTEYDQAKQLIREFGTDGKTIKMALVDSNYTFNSADTLFSDVSGDEVTGTAYTAGGEILTNVTVLADGTIDSDDVVWSTATISGIRRAILYYSGTIDSKVNPLLLSYLLDDTPADISVTATDLTLIINASGLIS